MPVAGSSFPENAISELSFLVCKQEQKAQEEGGPGGLSLTLGLCEVLFAGVEGEACLLYIEAILFSLPHLLTSYGLFSGYQENSSIEWFARTSSISTTSWVKLASVPQRRKIGTPGHSTQLSTLICASKFFSSLFSM